MTDASLRLRFQQEDGERRKEQLKGLRETVGRALLGGKDALIPAARASVRLVGGVEDDSPTSGRWATEPHVAGGIAEVAGDEEGFLGGFAGTEEGEGSAFGILGGNPVKLVGEVIARRP